MTSRQAMEEWNDGTIYRIHVHLGPVNGQLSFSVPVDIAQSKLTGKVLMGIEMLHVFRDLNGSYNVSQATNQNDDQLIAQQKYHCERPLYFFESFSLPPDIDFSTSETSGRNTQVFARVPVDFKFLAKGTQNGGDNADGFYENTGTYYQVLNKDSIMYEMTNNPNAISNGQLHFRIVDYLGQPFTNIVYMDFTLVIYKPRNTYN